LLQTTPGSNVLSLEMADYERTVSRLQDELHAMRQAQQTTNAELSRVTDEHRALTEEKAKNEQLCGKLKAAVVKLKKELKNHQELVG
jgi:chromosome segregation ATPase